MEKDTSTDDYHLLQPLLPPIHAEVVRDSNDDGILMNHTTTTTGGGDVSNTSSISEYMQNQEWKDHLCDCCIHGPCHPSLLWGCCFPAVGIAQVFYRLLHHRRRKVLFFWFITFLFIFNCILGYVLNIKVNQHCVTEIGGEEDGYLHGEDRIISPTCASWLLLQMTISFISFLITVFLIAFARHMVRKRHHIKPCIRTQYLCPTCCCCCCCGGGRRNSTSKQNEWEEEWLEDCCVSCCCPSCVTCQVMRQTGNYETYRASCCSYSGLPRGISHDYSV